MVLRKEIALQIKNLLKENPQGLIITDIVKKVDINRNTAGRYLENLLVSGQVEMRRFGMAKIYTLSQRVPLSALLSISSELILQLDSSLRVIFANEPFLLMVGTDMKSLLGKNIEYTSVALVFEDFITEFIKNLKEGVSGKEWIGEIVLRPKDIILFCRIAPTVFDDGRKGVTVILEDITQRKEAEEKLEESERQFRLLAENSLDMISRIKPDGTRIYASPAYKTTLGYEPEELIGKRNDDIIHPNDAHVLKSLRTILTHENPSAMVIFRTKHKDGHYIWIESAVKAIFDENTRELSEYYTVTRDITQRKKAEELLQESEERYRTLVEISPDPVIIHQQGKIIFVNPAAFKLLGASHNDEIIGKKILDFIQPDFREEIRKNIQKDLGGEATPSVELQMVRLDGTTIFVEGKGVKTNIAGKPAIQVALKDITKSKRAEEELRESEVKYRTVIERANDGVVVVQDGFIKLCNRSVTEFWGGSIEQILGRKFVDFVHPDAISEIITNYNRRMSGESLPPIYETILKRNDGSRFFAELNAGIISYEGKPANLIFIRDINHRKKTENDLQRSESLSSALSEASSDLIFVIGRDDRVEYVNGYASSLVNKPVDQIIGHPRTSLFPPDVSVYQKKALETVFETGTTLRTEDALTFACRTYWFDHILTPLRDADNHIKSVLGISRDISERKRMEKALQESEEKYRTIVSRANDMICIIQDGIIKMCNPRITEFWGSPAEEILGRPFTDFVHPDAISEIITNYNRRMAGESLPSIYETNLKRKDGSRSYVEVNAVNIMYEGKIADLVIVRDMNERKKAEKAFRESEATAHALMNAPTDSVLVIDDQGMILALNEIAASRFGKRSNELVGIMSYDLLPKEIAQLRRSLMAPVLDKKKMVRFMDERAGRWYDTVAYPILNETGEVKKIAIIARDITEQKTFEKRLRESEQMYKRLLEQTFDAIAIHKEGKIAFVNEKAVKILRAARPEDLVGKSIFEFIHPDSRKDLEDRIQKMRSDQGIPVPVITEKFIRTDGSTVTVEIVAIRFDDNGTPAFRVAFREISSP